MKSKQTFRISGVPKCWRRSMTLLSALLVFGVLGTFAQSASATYTAGDIPTGDGVYDPLCNGPLTTVVVNIPPGATVNSVDVVYDMTGTDGGWMSEQRSQIFCQETGLDEGTDYAGTGNGGTFSYNRTGLTIANGVSASGVLTFEMRAYRTYTLTTPGCSVDDNFVVNNTWTVTVNYTGGGACTGIPAPGNTTGPAASPTGVPINLGLEFPTPGTGVSYNWQESATSGGPWSNSGAPDLPTYSPVFTGDMYYRCEVTCTASAETTASNELFVAEQSSASATYTSGDIPTGDGAYDPLCNGPLTTVVVNIPPNATVTGVDVEYDMTGTDGGWMSEQRSQIFCQETGLDEGTDYSGTGNGGTFSYNRTGLNIANGVSVTGVLTFEMRAWRTTTIITPGCSVDDNFVNNNTWTVTVNYFGGDVCSATPAPGNTTGPSSAGAGSVINLGLQNATPGSGVTYQWQESATSGGPWTNVGPDADTYSPTITADTYYRCEVTCPGNGTTASNELFVQAIPTCTYTLNIGDIYGDGWNGGEWELREDGSPILVLGPQLANCGPANLPVLVTEGATLDLVWTVAGTFPTEIAVQLFDNNGLEIFTFRGISGSANCPAINWGSAEPTPTIPATMWTGTACPPPPIGCNTFPPPVPSFGPQLTPTCVGTPELVASGITGGQQNHVFLTAGTEYIFTSSIGTDHLTIADAVGINTWAGATSPLNFTPVTTGTYSFWANTDNTCPVADGPRDIFVQCYIPPNDLCGNAVNFALNDGGLETITGDVTNSTDDIGLGGVAVWHEFTTTECMDVVVDYCGNTPVHGVAFQILVQGCDPGQTIFSDAGFVDCGDGNPIYTYSNLPAGTYQIPVYGANPGVSTYSIDVSGTACPLPPPNDLCAGATPIVPSPQGTGCTGFNFAIPFTTDGTTDSGVPTAGCGSTPGNDQWFTWTATSTGLQWWDGIGNPGISIFADCANGTAGTEIACFPTFQGNGILTGWNLGDPLIIHIFDFDGSISDISFCLEEYTPPPPPANDDCLVAPTVLTLGPCPANEALGDNTSATDDGGTPTCDTGGPWPDVWYQFNSGTATSVDVTFTNISMGDIVLTVLEGSCVGTEVFCNIGAASPTLVVTPGTDYYIRVSNNSGFGAGGQHTVCVSETPPPPPNDLCGSAVNFPLNDGDLINVTGTVAGATDDLGFGNSVVWHEFTTTECLDVTVDYCGNSPVHATGFQVLVQNCDIGQLTFADGGFVDCGDGNPIFTYYSLAAGTYQIPVYGDNPGVSTYSIDVGGTACPPPPGNEDCLSATPLTLGAFGTCPANEVVDNNSASTEDYGAPGCDTGGPFLDLWYSFNSGSNTEVNIDFTSITMGDAMIVVLEDNCTGTEVLCNIGAGSFNLTVLPGTDYYIMITSNTQFGGGGLFSICVSGPPPIPANDDCANAEPMSCNTVVSGTTLGSTDDPEATALNTCGTFYSGGQGVWYVIDGWDGTMSATTCDAADFDTKISVYEGACGSLTCVGGNDDDFTCTGNTSTTSWTATSGTTYYLLVHGFLAATGNFDLTVTCADAGAPCPVGENTVDLEITTDANGGETSYGIEAAGIPGVELCSGSGLPSNGVSTETCCLPDGCYRVRVYDSGNDGIVGGGYVVRDGNGERIIDNEGNFTTGGESSMSDASLNPRYFCLPLGNDRLIYTHCDKEDFEQDDFVIASANAAVNAEYGGPNAGNSGYVFSIFNPNGNYMRFAYYTHANPAVGAPAGPSAAQHLRHNGWFTLPVPGDELMNVRVRSVVAGVASPYGPVCRYMWLTAQPTCPLTQLVDNPNNSNHSCDVTRTHGTSDKLVAWNVPGATGYVFKFDLVGEVDEWNLWSNTNALLLNWDNDVLGLTLNAPYLVSVSAYVNGSFCPFGPECPVTLLEGPMAQNRELGVSSATMELYPNPNRGDNVNLSLNELPEDLDEVSIEIHDAFGKRVHAQTIAQPGSSFNTVLELDGNLSNGIYMVSVIVGDEVLTQKLTVQ